MDQNPRRYDRLELYQGIANLAANGPEDGGLCVLKGSHVLHDAHFASIGGFREEQDTGEKENLYHFTAQDAQWYKSQGCEEIKICANQGDLIGQFFAIDLVVEFAMANTITRAQSGTRDWSTGTRHRWQSRLASWHTSVTARGP